MWWKSVRAKIERADTSTYRTADGVVQVKRPRTFKAMPLSIHKEVNDTVEAECKKQFERIVGRDYDTVASARQRAEKLGPIILNTANGPASIVERVRDAIGFRDVGIGQRSEGGMANTAWMTGVNGADPSKSNFASPNMYISPAEAAAIVSQRGLPEIIINKKAKSMLLNGVHINNSRLSEDQLERVQEQMVKTDLAKAVSDALRDALVYSGSILFPFFKTDSPLALTLPVETLAKHGIVKKGCIERWTVLDRWNTVHFPNWNPTSEDFLKPRYFYVPFLGTDIHSSRIARIVPAPQPGYWGVMMNMGWGVSDISGWIEAVFNYYNVMRAIPTMIQQMSLLVRTFNVEGPMALEGSMILDQMADEDTVRIRQASALNPINMDIVGELKAVQRDFGEVPELCRLIRQDVAAKAGLLEQSLFTVDPKGMGSGGNKQQPWTRQEETNRFMYTDVQQQLKQIAKLHIIDTLGTDRDIIKALPFTEIRFDEQKVTDVEDRVKVVAATSKGFFDAVAGGMPLPDAAEMMEQLSGGLFHIDAELHKRLEERQDIIDEREQAAHEAEIAGANMMAAKGPAAPGKDGEGHSYKDPLEQKKHEKVRAGGSKKQGLQKARNKQVGKGS